MMPYNHNNAAWLSLNIMISLIETPIYWDCLHFRIAPFLQQISTFKHYNNMRTSKLILLACLSVMLAFTSCEDDDDNNQNDLKKEKFVTVESPYLICASRNPGGVGFDFEYNNEKGGANNADSPSVENLRFDVTIRTIKGEKPDGSLGGAPFIALSNSSVEAINYSSVDPTCKGYEKFKALSSSNIQSHTLKTDKADFDVTILTKGQTGKSMMNELQAEYSKLVIGEKWKGPAKNNIENDEPIWIIKTAEGRLVKFIVTQFPANPAPTTTGYVAIDWDFVD